MTIKFSGDVILDDAGFLESLRRQSHSSQGPAKSSASLRGKPAIAATTWEAGGLSRANPPMVKPAAVTYGMINEVSSADTGYTLATEGGVKNILGKREEILPYDILLKEGVDDGRFSRTSRLEQDVGQEDEGDSITEETSNTGGGGAGPVTGAGKTFPVLGPYTVSSHFGPRWGRMHNGIDLAIPTGRPCYAITSGRVEHLDNPGGYGWYIFLHGDDGNRYTYAHMSERFSVGQVENGAEIGKSGGAPGAQGAGNSQGEHLHFELFSGGGFIDPWAMLQEIEWEAVRAVAARE